MSLTIVIWLSLFSLLAIAAFYRPAWGVALYMLSFFMCPPFWWWGGPITGYRWNFYAGVVLLISVIFSRLGTNANSDPRFSPLARRTCWIGFFILINATIIHFLLADNLQVSGVAYFLLAKFALLFFMMVFAIRTEFDLRMVLMSMLLGIGYIGYEVTINERGSVHGNRLEGVGAPSASNANEFASLIVTLLPLTGALLIAGNTWERLAAFAIAPLAVNTILLCNSRGAFLAALTSAIVFLVVAPRETRTKALKIIGLGCFVTYLLLGDPRIVDRFTTTFAEDNERDRSAQSRLEFWGAGLAMIGDYPLGAGGNGFKRQHGIRYLRSVGATDIARSVHNGYINETCEWGIQGLLLRLGFVLGALHLLWKSYRKQPAVHEQQRHLQSLLGCATIAAMCGFLVTCLFGDFLDAEWGYWMAAIMVAQSRVFAPALRKTSTNLSTTTPQALISKSYSSGSSF